jgi:2-polyprenyl-3-methyl-5-hydroxy-6-metoxy-1,4-benzoquinol methylase
LIASRLLYCRLHGSALLKIGKRLADSVAPVRVICWLDKIRRMDAPGVGFSRTNASSRTNAMRTVYDLDFFEGQAEGSQNSAAIVVPLAMSLMEINSVVDVGCGVGGWLRVFAERGVRDCLGIDGEYVDRSALRIPTTSFKAVDLRTAFDVGERFDLACSLEVAEHLPASAAEGFVASLTRRRLACSFRRLSPVKAAWII